MIGTEEWESKESARDTTIRLIEERLKVIERIQSVGEFSYDLEWERKQKRKELDRLKKIK